MQFTWNKAWLPGSTLVYVYTCRPGSALVPGGVLFVLAKCVSSLDVVCNIHQHVCEHHDALFSNFALVNPK